MRSKGSCSTAPHHPIITAPTSLSFLHLLLINTQEWISRVIKSSALPAKSLIVLIVNPDQMLVKIKLEKWLGQVPPPAFQGCDSLQHPSPLSQLFSARLCSFGRNSSSHCGIWHGACGHGRHRAMGDGVSSPSWPCSLRRGLPKGQFPGCGVECAAPPAGAEDRARHLQAGSEHPRAAGHSMPRNGLQVGGDTLLSILQSDFCVCVN